MKTLRNLAAALMCMGCLAVSFSCNSSSDRQQIEVSSAPTSVSPTSISPRAVSPTDPAKDAQAKSSPPKLLPSVKPASPQATTLSGKAEVKDAYGEVQQRTGAGAAWRPVNVGDLLASTTTVRTGKDAAVLLLLADRHIIRLGAETTLGLSKLGRDRSFSFELAKGRFWSYVNSARRPAKYEVETPSAVVGVSGTIFSVFYQPRLQDTLVSTAEGIVTVRQGPRAVKVPRGFGTHVPRNSRMSLRAIPQDQATQRMWQLLRRQEAWPRKSRTSPDATLRLNRQMQTNNELRRLHIRLDQLKRNTRTTTHKPGPPRRVRPARDRRTLQSPASQSSPSKRRNAQPFKSLSKSKSSPKKLRVPKRARHMGKETKYLQIKDKPKHKDKWQERKDQKAKPQKVKLQKAKPQQVRRSTLRGSRRTGRFGTDDVQRTGSTKSKDRGLRRDFEDMFKGEQQRKEHKGERQSGNDERFNIGEFLHNERKGNGHKGRRRD